MTPGSAPSVTIEQVQAAIINETYTILPDGRTTVCQLTLYNNFTVEGYSACVCPENFDAEKGQKYSRERAVEKIWPLLGFLLAENLYRSRDKAPEALSVALVPRVGDQVRFFEQCDSQISNGLVAFVASVGPQGALALTVLGPDGSVHSRTGVSLLNPGDVPSPDLKYFARSKE